MAWAIALAGAAASAYGASQSNKSSKNAGKVDVYHSVTPYGDSGFYKDAIAQQAYKGLFGQDPPPGVGNMGPQTPGATTPVGGGGLRPSTSGSTAGATRVNKDGKTVPVRNGKKSGGGGTAKTPGTTQQAIDNSMRVAGTMENSAVNRAAQDYTAGTLSGEDQNPYRAETADQLRGLNDTEYASNYQRLLDGLWGSDTGLPGSGGGGGGRGGGGSLISYGYKPGTGGSFGGNSEGQGPVGVVDDLKSLLAGNDSPAVAGLQAKIKRQGDEALAEQQKALRLRAAGSGMGGGSGQDYAEGTAMGKYGGYLADANASLYGDLYSQALGLGTQYDTAALDRAAAERSAGAASAGSAAAAAAEMSSRERMQKLDLLSNLTGMGLDMDKFKASGFGSLGEGFSGDQRSALGLAGDVNGMGQSGWLAAGGLSLGRDQTNNQLRASLAGTGVQRQALEFDKYKYNREAPLRDLTQFGGLIGGLYDPYATSHDYGFDGRSQSPSYSNPWAQGLAGAASGYQLGKDIRG